MIGHIAAFFRFFADARANLGTKLLFLAAVLYVVFPADAIPDLIPILGWLDDFGLFGLASVFVARKLGPYLGGPREDPLPQPAVVETEGVEIR